jgi:hypothetical protein
MKRKNINIIKIIYALSISFMFLTSANAGKVKEAILLTDLSSEELTNHHKRRYSKWAEELNLEKEADVYSFHNENTFERLFPSYLKSSQDYEDKSFYAGQISSVWGNNGVGTGILLDVGEFSGSVRAIGITAMHNFVSIKDEVTVISPKFTKQFFLGAKSVVGEDVDNYGTMKIDKVLVQRIPSKDICLFEGTISPNSKHFWARDGVFRPEDAKQEDIVTDFISSFIANKPEIVEKEIIINNENCKMYHYPFGKRNQRKNEGTIFHSGKHQIRSLFGSSGASIFNEQFQIVGIHRGFDLTALKDKVVEISEGDIPVVEYNSFVKVSKSDYDSILREGVDLYGGDIKEDFIHSLSQFAAENLKDYD